MNLLAGTKNPHRDAPSTSGHWRRHWRLPLFIAAVADLFVVLRQFALAQGPPEHVFFGTVTVNRLPPKDGTVLTALVDGRNTASTKIIDGVFEFHVKRPADRPLAGKVVRFRVGNLETSARAIWTAGKETELNIRVIHVFQTPVPIPRRQVARIPDSDQDSADQDTDEVQDIQRKIQVLTQDRASVETNLKEQVQSKLAALDEDIDLRKEDLREAASETDSTETDLRKDFNQKMRLLDQERADREKELIRLANDELDDLDRRIQEAELELKRRITRQDSADGRPEVAVQSKEDEPVAVAASETAGPGPDKTPAEGKGNSSSRGFFFNSVSGNVSGIDKSLDPTTIAVLGILITLIATTIQLVKGN